MTAELVLYNHSLHTVQGINLSRFRDKEVGPILSFRKASSSSRRKSLRTVSSLKRGNVAIIIVVISYIRGLATNSRRTGRGVVGTPMFALSLYVRSLTLHLSLVSERSTYLALCFSARPADGFVVPLPCDLILFLVVEPPLLTLSSFGLCLWRPTSRRR